MKTIQIKNCDGGVIYTTEVRDDDDNPIHTAVREACFGEVSLAGADLAHANLKRAFLENIDLRGANLTRADLTGADLTSANLTGANLYKTKFTSTNIYDIMLGDTNFEEVDLEDIRGDFDAVMTASPNEVPGILDALRAGRIDGNFYYGDCTCLLGTIAKLRQCDLDDLGAININLLPDQCRPIECLFQAVAPGNTPQNHPVARVIEAWILEWQGKIA